MKHCKQTNFSPKKLLLTILILSVIVVGGLMFTSIHDDVNVDSQDRNPSFDFAFGDLADARQPTTNDIMIGQARDQSGNVFNVYESRELKYFDYGRIFVSK